MITVINVKMKKKRKSYKMYTLHNHKLFLNFCSKNPPKMLETLNYGSLETGYELSLERLIN